MSCKKNLKHETQLVKSQLYLESLNTRGRLFLCLEAAAQIASGCKRVDLTEMSQSEIDFVEQGLMDFAFLFFPKLELIARAADNSTAQLVHFYRFAGEEMPSNQVEWATSLTAACFLPL